MASQMPAAAPNDASMKLSASVSRIGVARLAPSARRMAASRRFATARPSMSMATLAQVTSRTSNDPTADAASTGRALP